MILCFRKDGEVWRAMVKDKDLFIACPVTNNDFLLIDDFIVLSITLTSKEDLDFDKFKVLKDIISKGVGVEDYLVDEFAKMGFVFVKKFEG